MKRMIKLLFILLSSMLLCCGCQNTDPQQSQTQETMQQNTSDQTDVDKSDADKSDAGKSDDSGAQSGNKGQMTAQNPDTADNEKDINKAADTTIARPSVTGALKVVGNQMTDMQGTAVQLKGISTHGLSWFPEYINQDCFSEFAKEWNVNVIRLAMYTAEDGGYCTDGEKEKLKQIVDQGVEYATNADMYVIIDWHVLKDLNPNTNKEEAIKFFEEMSKKYADHNNVLYEICNEPNGDTSWADIKKYAKEVIPVIRANDSDAIIIVGTPTWSQRVDEAAADPITEYDNIMYTLHYYAATHKDDLRQTMSKAVEAGLPVFVTEYGICDCSGNGQIDEQQADAWINLMNQYHISYVAWNLSNKNETSAILKPDCQKTSGFGEEDISDSGKWLYHMLMGSTEKKEPQVTNGKATENTGQVAEPSGASEPSEPSVTKKSSGKDTMLNDYDLKMSNSWEADGKIYYQYELTINNTSQSDRSNWSVNIEFTDKPAISDSWNANVKVTDHTINITPVDYNSIIKAGESVKDIGFIISGSEEMKVK